MTPVVLALIAVGAITHAAWNLAIKRSHVGGPVFLWLSSITASIVVVPFAIVSVIADAPDWGVLLVAAVVSGVLHVGYFLLLQKGYSVGDVSVVYPLARGSGPLITIIVAIAVLGERPAPLALAGAAVIITGVVVIGLAGGRAGMRNARAGVLFGLLTGVLIAAYTLWDATAVTMFAIAPVVLSWAGTTTEALLLTPVAVRNGRRVLAVWRNNWREVLTVGILSPVSYIAILIAMQLAPISLVAPGREVSVVLVSLAGWLIFKEPNPRQRLLGAGVVLVGVALLGLG